MRTPVASAAWRVVEEFLSLRQTCGDSRSATGGQLEALRLGQVGEQDEWRRHDAAERKYHRLAVLETYWARLERGPDGDRYAGLLDAAIVVAGHTPTRLGYQFRELHHSELPSALDGSIDSDEMQRRSGWEQIGVWRDHMGQRLQAREGCLWFRRVVPACPTQTEVASRMGLTVSRVRAAYRRCIEVFTDLAEEKR